ncbi:MAG: hypothetical protein DMD34_03615 [Gemmatimonadetes bacterium]|nr:MAG: hypothetical protein DMD34_03615 [Gemmatimonadota bacterium]
MPRLQPQDTRVRRFLPVLASLVASLACGTGVNYTSAIGPRYIGGVTPAVRDDVPPPPLRLVTFNIQYAQAIDSAIAVLRSAEPLRHADIITLQEMDAPGTSRIADALGMSYVYYPATIHPATNRDFGNAILSHSRRPSASRPRRRSSSASTRCGCTACISGRSWTKDRARAGIRSMRFCRMPLATAASSSGGT